MTLLRPLLHSLLTLMLAAFVTACVGELPQDLPDSTDDTQDDGSGDVPGDTPGDTPDDTPDDAPDDTPDDTPDDMAMDMQDEEMTSNPATLRLRLPDGSPGVGADVVFHDADGAIIAEGETNEEGEFIHEIPEGGIVTFDGVLIFGGGLLVTVYDVNPGDLVLFQNLDEDDRPSEELGEFRVKLPNNSTFQWNEVRVSNNCDTGYLGAASFETSLNINRQCINEDDSMTLTAYGKTSGSNFFDENAVFTNLPAIDASDLTIEDNDWHPWREILFNVSSVPLNREVRIDGEYEIGNRVYWYPENEATLPGDGERALRYPDNPAHTGFRYSIRVDNPDTSGSRAYASRAPQAPENPQIDLQTQLLPPVTNVTMMRPPMARPVITWTTPAQPNMFDVYFAMAFWTSAQGERQWALIGSPQRQQFILPELPEGLSFKGITPDTVDVQVGLNIVDGSWVSNYGEAKADVLRLLSEFSFPTSDPEWFMRTSSSADLN